MESLVEIMLPPLVACLILTGIHTYLGLHVVSRGVIFVDLALAQIAALGSTMAFLLGFEPDSSGGYLYSLGFAFLGAAIFSLTRLKDQRVPQEALIGITFVVASSAAILIADQAPQGAEHVEEMLTGAILWVSWPTILKTLLIYTAIGLFHFTFRHQFLLISIQPGEAERRGLAVRWWDFLFYMSFGFVITSSVAMAGILLVFCFLIIPSVIAMIYSNRIGTRLVIGWLSGTCVSFIGLFMSYQFDLPSGPSIVCSFGAVLALAAVAHYLWTAESWVPALARVGAGIIICLMLAGIALQFRPSGSISPGSSNSAQEKVLGALDSLSSEGAAVADILVLLNQEQETFGQILKEGSFEIDQRTVQRLGEEKLQESIPILRIISSQVEDPWIRYYANLSLLRLGEKESIHVLIQVLESPGAPFLKAQIRNILQEISGQDYGYDPLANQESNQGAINRWEVWWHEHAAGISWDPQQEKFVVR